MDKNAAMNCANKSFLYFVAIKAEDYDLNAVLCTVNSINQGLDTRPWLYVKFQISVTDSLACTIGTMFASWYL